MVLFKFFSLLTATGNTKLDAKEARADWGFWGFYSHLSSPIPPSITFWTLHQPTIQGPASEVWSQETRWVLARHAQRGGPGIWRLSIGRPRGHLSQALRLIALSLSTERFHYWQPNCFSLLSKEEGPYSDQFTHLSLYRIATCGCYHCTNLARIQCWLWHLPASNACLSSRSTWQRSRYWRSLFDLTKHGRLSSWLCCY